MKLHEAIELSIKQGTRTIKRGTDSPCFYFDSCHYTVDDILEDTWEVEPAPVKKMKLWVSDEGHLKLCPQLPCEDVYFWREVDLKELIEGE